MPSISLTTPVAITPPHFAINHSDSILLLGSCFADHIGQHLSEAGFNVLCNPFGVLYNPLSIASCLARSQSASPITTDDLVQHDGQWHSWLHHSRFSAASQQECLQLCNQSVDITRHFLAHCNTIILTLGTAFVYHLVEQQERVVANCHRLPANNFTHRRCTIDQCIEALESIHLDNYRLIITVSPIRHMADGAHGNQLSKATLLLAAEQYTATHPNAYYFPAYELLLDEMRDYRFYDRDLTHPSPLAVDIIWQRFQETFFSSATQNQCLLNEKEHRRHQHRPISNQSK